MKKLVSLSIIFEITRRCNLKCRHCLRGDAETVTASPDVRNRVARFVNWFFNKTDVMPFFCFGGGEPMLVAGQIHDMLYLMPREQEVAITTNGRVWSKHIDPLINLLTMNPYRKANIKISNDQFHREEGTINDKWFTAQELYSDLIWIDNEDISSRSIVRQGKAIDNGIGKRALITGGHFYINVFGDIFDSCNFSYETQREETPLGNISDDFYKLLEIAEQVGDTEETEEEEEERLNEQLSKQEEELVKLASLN